METYIVDARMVLRNDKDELREQSNEAIFTAENDHRAFLAALRYTERIFKVLGELRNYQFVGAILINQYRIAPIDEQGNSATTRRERLFEWKRDTGLYQPRLGQNAASEEIRDALDRVKNLKPQDHIKYFS